MQLPEREALLAAAREVLRERGLAGVTVAAVLARAGLGTRAFYRHFASKDQLLVEVFAQATRTEIDRLLGLMAPVGDPVAAVSAWIGGRLDLAFDPAVESDLKPLSEQARALYAVDPGTMAGLYAAMVGPLVEQVAAGITAGVLVGDPEIAALGIASLVEACIEREWMSPSADPAAVRALTLELCLRAVGAPPAG